MIRTPTGEIRGPSRSRRARRRLLIDAEGVRYQLAVVFRGGWRIVESTPAERALLDAHGFGGRRVQ
jgi:hypothetical protein